MGAPLSYTWQSIYRHESLPLAGEVGTAWPQHQEPFTNETSGPTKTRRTRDCTIGCSRWRERQPSVCWKELPASRRGMRPRGLGLLLAPNIRYYGIDIAIQEPSPNLKECDILQEPITSEGAPFDLIVAQGLFEYLADHQSRKFAEIADLLTPDGTAIVSYVNFDHRRPDYYWPYSNIQPSKQFRDSLKDHFVVDKQLPTSHNWNHTEPGRWYVRVPNMYLNVNVPWLTSWLGVEYLTSADDPHERTLPSGIRVGGRKPEPSCFGTRPGALTEHDFVQLGELPFEQFPAGRVTGQEGVPKSFRAVLHFEKLLGQGFSVERVGLSDGIGTPMADIKTPCFGE